MRHRPDIIRIADRRNFDLVRLTPEGKLRGPLVWRLGIFFFLNSVVAGLVGAVGGRLFL